MCSRHDNEHLQPESKEMNAMTSQAELTNTIADLFEAGREHEAECDQQGCARHIELEEEYTKALETAEAFFKDLQEKSIHQDETNYAAANWAR